METELDLLGIVYKHSWPYHPQTCGEVERFHQTLKRWLARQPAVSTIADAGVSTIADAGGGSGWDSKHGGRDRRRHAVGVHASP